MPTRIRLFSTAFAVLLALPLCAFGQRRPATDTIVISLALAGAPQSPAQAQALRGAIMSLEESARSAALLRRSLRLDTLTSRPVRNARFIIAFGDQVPSGAGGVVLLTSCTASSSASSFSLCGAGIGDSVIAWDPALEKFGASQLNDRFVARWKQSMDDAAWRGWLAAKVAWEAAIRGPAGDEAMARWLVSPAARFDGHQGVPLFFEPDHRIRHPRYRVTTDHGGRILKPIP